MNNDHELIDEQGVEEIRVNDSQTPVNAKRGKLPKGSMLTYMMKLLEKNGHSNIMTDIILANDKALREMFVEDLPKFLDSILFDRICEYSTLSALYTDGIAVTFPASLSQRDFIDTKIKIDNMLFKSLGILKSLRSVDGQVRVNGKTVNIAWAQQIASGGAEAKKTEADTVTRSCAPDEKSFTPDLF